MFGSPEHVAAIEPVLGRRSSANVPRADRDQPNAAVAHVDHVDRLSAPHELAGDMREHRGREGRGPFDLGGRESPRPQPGRRFEGAERERAEARFEPTAAA